MRILVTGSRDWTDEDVITGALLSVTRYTPGEGITVVHGDCPTGADKIAKLSAQVWGWNTEAHPADWNRFGKAAGPIRNVDMVKSGVDLCLAFIKGNSRGATQCAAVAEQNGVKTWRYTA